MAAVTTETHVHLQGRPFRIGCGNEIERNSNGNVKSERLLLELSEKVKKPFG